MFSNQHSNQAKAIERFPNEKLVSNTEIVYATYNSGMFNGFYATKQEAIDHCSNPENGNYFNNHWFQDEYSVFFPGELFCVVNNESVYLSDDRSRYLNAVMGKWQIPFTDWKPVLSTRQLAVQRP